MKRIVFILLLTLLVSVSKADIPAGYAIYGTVPSGYTDLTANVSIGDWGGGYNGFQTSYIEYTGKGLGGNVGEGNYLCLSFTTEQQLQLTSTFRVHIVMRKTADSENSVQFSLCRDGWNSNRAGKTIAAASLSTDYQDIVLANTELTESAWGTIRTGDETTFGTGHVMRFCAVDGEVINIKQIYIENVFTPFVQSAGLGILRAKALPIYAETSTFVPTGASVDNINLYVVSVNQDVYARMTSTGHSFDAGFADNYQLRTWKSNGDANATGNTVSPYPYSDGVMFTMTNGLFGIESNADCYVSARAKLWGQGSIRCSAQLYFRGTYVCTPTGDKTAPTATVSPYYDGEHFTVTISATDNSGEVFYYAENTTRGTKQISFVPTFVLNGAVEGDIITCYAVDFDGNMSSPMRVGAMTCNNCFIVN